MRKIFRAGVAAIIVAMVSPALALTTGQCFSMSDMNAALKTEGQRSLIIGDRLDYEGQAITVAGTTMTRTEWKKLSGNLQSDTPVRRNIIAGLRAKGRTQNEISAFITRLRDVSAIVEKGDPDAPVPKVMTAFISNGDGSIAYILEGDKPSGIASTRGCIRARLTAARLADRMVDTDMFVAKGDVQQLNGTVVSGVAIALRGDFQSGEAKLVVLQPGNPPLFYISGAKLTAFASQNVQR